MKIPDQLTLEWNNLSFMQVDNKGEQTTRGIRIGNAGTLALKDFGTKQIELGTVTAPRGSLVLEKFIYRPGRKSGYSEPVCE